MQLSRVVTHPVVAAENLPFTEPHAVAGRDALSLRAAVTSDEFRAIMGRFVTGVTVVTMRDEAGPHGATVNSFTSLSLDPALVLVCLVNQSRSSRIISTSGAFAVNILSNAQQDLGRRFARAGRAQGADAFEGVAYRDGATGSPLLAGSVAQIDCMLSTAVPAGDHTIFIGEVVGLGEGTDHGPLAFHRGQFLPLAG